MEGLKVNIIETEKDKNIASPSQLWPHKDKKSNKFRFLKDKRDKMGTQNVTYRQAQLNDSGKKWFVYYSYKDHNGRFKRFKVYEDINRIKNIDAKRIHAKSLVDAVNHSLKTGFNPFQPRGMKVYKTWTLVQCLNYFKQNLPSRGLRKRTIQSYESVLRTMYKGLDTLLLQPIESISKSQISNFLNHAANERGWTNSTYNNNLTFIRAIFNYLIDQEIIEKNPALRIKPLPESITRNKYFDDATFEKIKKKADPELLDFLLFLYHTGTRPNEARQLRYEHIHRDTELLFIPASISKNKKDDYVPLTEYILTKYVQKSGLIFGTSVNYFTQKFNKLKEKLKLPKEMNLYSIKHTRAVHLAQDGASPYAILQLFRHSNLEITQKYLRDLGLTVNREAAEKVR